jgi:FkbM family methyltransferase
MSLRERFYKSLQAPHSAQDLHEFVKERGIDVNWIVEAGCQDGSDTEILATLFNPFTYYAFEPDPVAFEFAKNRIRNLASKGHSIELSKFALMNVSGDGSLVYIGHPGGGSTQIRSTEKNEKDDRVQIIKFDDLRIRETTDGLLWLDVEGNAVSVLQGMQESLQKFSVAKIEVEFHDMSTSRLQNFQKVISLMKNANFRVVKSDIRPGFFGDKLFVDRKLLNLKDFTSSLFVTGATFFLHGFLYPILKKPT